MSDVNFNITDNKAINTVSGGGGGSLSSTTSVNSFIDSDNNSTSERFNIYKNVSVASSGSILVAFSETGQHGFGTDTPFTDFSTVSGDFASSVTGLHIKSAGEAALLLEGPGFGGSFASIWMGGTSTPWRLSFDGTDDSLILSRNNANLSLYSRVAQFMVSDVGPSDVIGGLAVGMRISGGNKPGLFVCGQPNFNQSVIQLYMNTNTGLVQQAGRIAINNGFSATPSDRQMWFEAINDTGMSGLPSLTMKGNTSSALPPKIGFGTFTPSYFVEVDRLASGTNMVQMAGSNSANGSGNTLKAYRNLTATSTDSSLVFFHQDHASDDQASLTVRQDGSGDLLQLNSNGTDVLNVNSTGITTFGKAFNSKTLSTAVSASTAGQRVILVTDTSTSRTITLSTADAVVGREIHIKDASGTASITNTITIDTEGSELIDGVASKTIVTNYGSMCLISDGSNWFIIAGFGL